MATMTLGRVKVTLPLLIAMSVLGTGCGSVSKLVAGKKGRSSASRLQQRTPQLVSSFTVTADPRTGEFSIRPTEAGVSAQRNAVSAQATPYNRSWDLDLAGRATYNGTTHVLSGNVTLSSTSPTLFQNVKVIVTSISDTNVTVKNGDGVTDLTGANKPFWAFGNLDSSTPITKNWQFSVPTGVGFTFSLALYADVWTTPPGDGGAILGLWFLGSSPASAQGWAVGQGGKILHTTNGGTNWTSQNSNVAVDLQDVCFVNGEQGYAVGNAGTLLGTTNGGKTWRPQSTVHPTQTLHAVAFSSPSNGYAVGTGGLILRTADGGNTWDDRIHPDQETLFDVDTAGGFKVWAVGAAACLLVSADDGNTWSRQELPGAELPFPDEISFNQIQAVDFVDSTRGWIVGASGLMFRTRDGGSSWERLRMGSASDSQPSYIDVKFVSATLGWVTTTDGRFFRTSDGGLNWQEEFLPSGGLLLQTIAATSANTVWVGGTGGVVFASQDASSGPGGTYDFNLTGAFAHLNDVHFPSRTTGYAVGEFGTVLRSTDGGRNWSQLQSAPFGTFTGVFFIDDQTGWIAGSGGIFATTDGGESWARQSTPSGIGALNAVYMIDANVGWAVGTNGTILRTATGGQGVPPSGGWQRPAAGLGSNSQRISGTLYDVKFVGATDGYIIGQSNNTGMLLRTDDGTTWGHSYAGTSEPLFGIGTAPDGAVYVVGGNNTIRKLVGFDAFEQFANVPPGRLLAVEFIDANRGFIVGQSGTLLRTENGGDTWTQMDAGTNRDLHAVDFVDEDTGAVVGSDGVIRVFR
jgi:photosystem II stability/assembly factor-like uncharacterized protein